MPAVARGQGRLIDKVEIVFPAPARSGDGKWEMEDREVGGGRWEVGEKSGSWRRGKRDGENARRLRRLERLRRRYPARRCSRCWVWDGTDQLIGSGSISGCLLG